MLVPFWVVDHLPETVTNSLFGWFFRGDGVEPEDHYWHLDAHPADVIIR